VGIFIGKLLFEPEMPSINTVNLLINQQIRDCKVQNSVSRMPNMLLLVGFVVLVFLIWHCEPSDHRHHLIIEEGRYMACRCKF
jgi:hypothetical protein